MTTSTSAVGGQAFDSPAEKYGQQSNARPTIGQLLLPYWFSSEKLLAMLLLGVILAISFSGTYAFVELNEIQGKLTDALVARDWSTLKPLLVLSMTVGSVTVLLPIIATYCTGYLDLRWRTWLTHIYLDKWTANAHFYTLERDELISNADQRIAEDIRLTTESTLIMFTALAGVIVSTVTYTVVLWNIAGTLDFTVFGRQISLSGYMVYAAYLYCICHLALSHWLGKTLIGLNMHKQTVEADFRHQGMQVREYAEQIAFYKGGERENAHLKDRFEKVRRTILNILARTFSVMMGQSIYGHVFSLLPTLLALPLLLSEKISYGEMTAIVGAYAMLSGAISYFPQAYVSFTSWLALTNRLRDLQWAINKAETQQNGIDREPGVEQSLRCEKLSLQTPQGQSLTHIENWVVARGERWLVTGRSGSGKSTLLRACAGLWPYGEGQIRIPAGCTSLFLPQKSYIPAGTLKDALCYPNATDDFSDEECHQALLNCCLPNLANSLSVNERWQQKLSGGEQQRLAIARALLHRPDFIFLDEATSALDPETENALYRALVEQLPNSAVISVAHRASLAQFHSNTIDLTV